MLASDPPRSKSVVMTVFGDSIIPRGGKVWLGSLIALLAPFGMNDRLVRTSVFRLAEEGWLEARREGRRSLYTLTESGARRFGTAYKRIYFPAERQWNGKWTLVMIAAGFVSTAQRGMLRKELLWEGFSMIAPGVFAHPTGKEKALTEILTRTDTLGKVFVCSTSESELVEGRPLSDLIERSWELEPVAKGYRQFMERFEPLAQTLRGPEPIDPEQAFVIRTLLIHEFRRLQLQDPQLPLELLPGDWPATAAYALCAEVYQSVYAPAEQHIVETLRKEDEEVIPAAPEFFGRFGGLK